jgi:hypothetical protein
MGWVVVQHEKPGAIYLSFVIGKVFHRNGAGSECDADSSNCSSALSLPRATLVNCWKSCCQLTRGADPQ